jgi:hypothetical protein
MLPREPLERLLEDVTDEELEGLRDAILREEGRRRSHFLLSVPAPYPPLAHGDPDENAVERWARLLTWLAKDLAFPPAAGKRGVSIRLLYTETAPDAPAATILLQQALVAAGLLVGRVPEWMDATTTEVAQAERDAILIQMWDKPAPSVPWTP